MSTNPGFDDGIVIEVDHPIMATGFTVPLACPPKGNHRILRRPGFAKIYDQKQADIDVFAQAVDVILQTIRPRVKQLTGPVYVSAEFVFVKPPTTTTRYPTSRLWGDLDKLQRCLGDALVPRLLKDDSQIVAWNTLKCWGTSDMVKVSVAELGPWEVTL